MPPTKIYWTEERVIKFLTGMRDWMLEDQKNIIMMDYARTVLEDYEKNPTYLLTNLWHHENSKSKMKIITSSADVQALLKNIKAVQKANATHCAMHGKLREASTIFYLKAVHGLRDGQERQQNNTQINIYEGMDKKSIERKIASKITALQNQKPATAPNGTKAADAEFVEIK